MDKFVLKLGKKMINIPVKTEEQEVQVKCNFCEYHVPIGATTEINGRYYCVDCTEKEEKL